MVPQDAALKAVSFWLKRGAPQVFRLFGYAGTGKTTLARHLAEHADGEVKFAAFTGKAASVMRGKGCQGASTIHSLIYRARESGEEIPSFDLWDEAPASKAELIVIDECSMVDAELGRDLLSFGVPLLVLGDPAQLPPIQGGGFFTEAEPDVDARPRFTGRPPTTRSSACRWTSAPANISRPAAMASAEVVAKADLDPQRVIEADQVLVGRNPQGAPTTCGCASARLRGRVADAGDKLVCLRNNRKKGLFNGGLWTVKEARRARKTRIMTMRLMPDDESGRACAGRRCAANVFTGGIEQIDWAAPQALRRIRLRLRAHRAQGARLAMGRRRAVRRELRVSGAPREMALYRRDKGREEVNDRALDYFVLGANSGIMRRQPDEADEVHPDPR